MADPVYNKVAIELLRHESVSKGTRYGSRWGREMSTLPVRKGTGAAHRDQKERQKYFVIPQLSHYHATAQTGPLKVLVTRCLTFLEDIQGVTGGMCETSGECSLC